MLSNKLEQAKHTAVRRRKRASESASKPAKRANTHSPPHNKDALNQESTAGHQPETTPDQHSTAVRSLDSTPNHRVAAVRQVPAITGTVGLDLGNDGFERFFDDVPCPTQPDTVGPGHSTGDGLTPDAGSSSASEGYGIAQRKPARVTDESESEPDYDPSSLADFEEVVPGDLDAEVFMLYGPHRDAITVSEPKWSSNTNPIARAIVHPKSKLLYNRRAPGGDGWRVVTIVELSPHPAMDKFPVPFSSMYKSGPPENIKGNLAEIYKTKKSTDFFWATSLIYKPGKDNREQNKDGDDNWYAVKVDPASDLPTDPTTPREATAKKTRK